MQERTIARLRAGQETVPCDGRHFVSLVHVADMADAIAAALLFAPPGSTFNIVDEPIRYGTYLDHLATLLGCAPPPRKPGQPCPPFYRCRTTAARSILNWVPTYGIYADVR